MKTRNLYYHTVIKRTNIIKEFILRAFLAICSWPTALIEVFTRRSMGERHFLFPLCLFLALFLAVFPFTISHHYGASFFDIIGENITWYAYVIAFVIFSIKRYREIIREPGVYDFKKFTLSPGFINPWLRKISFFGYYPTSRIISIYVEPGIFALAGFILIKLNQNIGYVLAICSMIHSLSWQARYYLGDQFIMDKIDEMICNKELVNSFVEGLSPEETSGFEVYGQRPPNYDFRRKVAESMIEEEPAVAVL